MRGEPELADCLASLHAGCADVLTLGDATDEGANALDIWVPATASLAHGVRNVIAKAWALATDVA